MRIRILDPLLYELLNPSVRRMATTVTVKGKQIPGYHYVLPFDQRYTNHILDTLLSVIRFGGQGFVKTARGASVKRSHHAGLVHRVESGMLNLWHSLDVWLINHSGGLPTPDPTYLDVLIELVLQYVSFRSSVSPC